MSDAFVEVMNLATDEVQSYGPGVSPERAVRNAWLLEQGRAQDLTDEKLVMSIPVRRTQLTVSCGDWCAMTRTRAGSTIRMSPRRCRACRPTSSG